MFDSTKQYHDVYDHSEMRLDELQILGCLYSHLPLEKDIHKFGYPFQPPI